MQLVNENIMAVICLYLIFSDTPVVKSSAFYGRGSGSILMDDVDCTGNETNLGHCTYLGSTRHNCVHREDVGIICQPSAAG